MHTSLSKSTSKISTPFKNIISFFVFGSIIYKAPNVYNIYYEPLSKLS